MRDIHRIDRILFLLRKLWQQYPDFRLGQLLHNSLDKDLGFHTADASVEDTLRRELNISPLESLAEAMGPDPHPTGCPPGDPLRAVYDHADPALVDAVAEIEAGRVLADYTLKALTCLHNADLLNAKLYLIAGANQLKKGPAYRIK